MRKASNVDKYAPVPIPHVGTIFKLDGRKFHVTNVSLGQALNKEYVAQCDIETRDCRMVLLLTSSKPFEMEDNKNG